MGSRLTKTLALGLGQVAGPAVLDLLFAPTRLVIQNRAVHEAYTLAGRPYIGAVWHQHILFFAWYFSWRRVCVMVSRSFDGELIARILTRRGFKCARGSSTRGGREALEDLVEHCRRGWTGAIVADGPRGPAREAKIGPVIAARRSGLPLIAVACRFDRALYARSWDRTAVPLPGCTVTLRYADPVFVPPNAGEAEYETIRRRLQETLNLMTDELHNSLPAKV